MAKRSMAVILAAVLVLFLLASTGAALAAKKQPKQSPVPGQAIWDQTKSFSKPVANKAGIRKLAVLIGIRNWLNADEVMTALRDINAVKCALVNQYAFPQSNIVTLLDKEATMGNIVAALNWLIQNSRKTDYIVFYYRGHGGVLGTCHIISTWEDCNIPDKDLAYALGLVRCARAWIGFDCCHAGGFNEPGITGKNRVVTAACAADQVLEVWMSYCFTWSMVKSGIDWGWADTNSDGSVSIEDAFRYARLHRPKKSPTPQIYDDYPGEMTLY